MYFTREDYLKIEEWLKLNAIKDTEFKDAELPVKELDTITLVQEGKNVKVSLKDFIDLLFNLGVSDFLNITDKYKQRNITIEQAISLIPSRARKKGLVITFLNSDGKWVLYQFKGELNQWNIIDLWDNIFDINKYIINSIIPDEEDLTMSLSDSNGNSHISLKDREYNPQEFSGKGRIILRKNIVEEYSAEFGKVKKNILVLDMINLPNTIYEIRYDFDLNGKEITIPEGCVLDFKGGSLSNGILNGNNTFINSYLYTIFYGITFKENSVFNNNWYVEWFGADIKRLDNNIPINIAFKELRKCRNSSVLYLSNMYKISNTIYITDKVSLIGFSRNKKRKINELGCGISAIFTDKNKWIIDTDNSIRKPIDYNSVDFIWDDVAGERSLDGNIYSNFDIICENPVYGGIRLFNIFNCEISNIYIFGTWKGIFMSWGWNLNFNNLWIESYYNAIHFGKGCTTSTWNNPFILYPPITEKIISFNKPFIYPDKSLPPYTDIKTPAIILEGVENSDKTNITMFNPIIQGYSAIAIGHRCGLTMYHPYFENHDLLDTIVWGYDTYVNITSGYEGGIIGARMDSYDFGTYKGVFNIEDIPFCRCYDPYDENKTDSNWYKYNIDVNKLSGFFYYDKYVLTSEGRFVSGKRTLNKTIINPPNNFIINDDVRGNIWLPYDELNVGNYVDWKELLKRTINDKTINIEYSKYVDLTYDGFIKDKVINIFFPVKILNWSTITFKVTATLKVNNCIINIQNGKSLSIVNEVTPFEIDGNLVIHDGGGWAEFAPSKTIFKLIGTKNINVLWDNCLYYNRIEKNHIDSSNFKGSYEIRIIGKNGSEKIYTNTMGNTEDRPINAKAGFYYFDTTLNKPIWKKEDTGTIWVDATGAEV